MVEETPVLRPTARGSLRLPTAELRGLLDRAGQFAKTEGGAAFSVLRWPHGENQGCGRDHACASDAEAAGR